jgi:diaminohydroxyphosphoribosylaminopyrimidine deaminase/5-amino-6-(5-phosphoribosylamino)uracil reductase
VSRGRPRVTLKLATSLDSRIALADGRSKWITGDEARAQVHEMRASHEVMLTGIGTVLADDPQLTARPGGVAAPKQPRRAVMDSRARTPADGAFVAAGPVTIFHAADDPPAALAEAGAEMVRMPLESDGRASLTAALAWLQDTGAQTVMIEAGGDLAARAIAADVVDRIEWFRAPILLGGDGRPAIAALGLESLDAPPTFRRVAMRECGRDAWESWERI